MSDNNPTARALEILMERMCWEASEFEKDVVGDPFLPDASDKSTQDRFVHFSVDLETFIGCDRESLRLPSKAVRPCLLYHASWMTIPGHGMLLDSSGQVHENRQEPADHRSDLFQLVEAVRRAIDRPGRNAPLPRFFKGKGASMASGRMYVRPPFLFVLYVSGRSSAEGKRFYNLVSGVFVGEAQADGQLLDRFEEAIQAGGPNTFYALHYTTLPSVDRLNLFPTQVHNRIKPMIAAIAEGTHPIHSPLGRNFIEALTVHFQRQWGDRQEHQRRLDKSRRALEGNISHELCRNLYVAIGLLDQGQGYLHTRPPETFGNIGRYLEAADETVRACLAVPYLSRRTRKGDARPIWMHRDTLVTEDERARVLAMFDRKLTAICDAERPVERAVKVWREYCVDGETVETACLLDLSERPGDWRAGPTGRSYTGWPLAVWDQESAIDNQGRQAILFGPHIELIRNAVEAASRLSPYRQDDNAAAYGIRVKIDMASDGSKITGSVSNKFPFGQNPSVIPDDFLIKFANMSEWLKARFVDNNETFHVEWTLHLQGSNDRGEESGDSP